MLLSAEEGESDISSEGCWSRLVTPPSFIITAIIKNAIFRRQMGRGKISILEV